MNDEQVSAEARNDEELSGGESICQFYTCAENGECDFPRAVDSKSQRCVVADRSEW